MKSDMPENLKNLDDQLLGALKETAPGADFEERIISSLPAGRIEPMWKRLKIHPAVLKSAGAVAAVVALAAIGSMAIPSLNRARDVPQARAYARADARRASTPPGLKMSSDAARTGAETMTLDGTNSYSGGTLVLDSQAKGLGSKVGDESGAQNTKPQTTTFFDYKAGEINQREDAKSAKDDLYFRASNALSASVARGMREGIANNQAQRDGDVKRMDRDRDFNGDSSSRNNVDQSEVANELGEKVAGNKSGPSSVSLALPRGEVALGDLDGRAETGKNSVNGTVAAADKPVTSPAPNAPPDVGLKPVVPQAEQQVVNLRKIIRNGEMIFEVDSFDSSLITLTRLAGESGGFVASTDSAKLPNGKMSGTIVVRMPPDRLDVFVLQLRGLGDLKSQRIGAQDVTKQYTDLESQLRAARAMEERLLDVIKKGQGAIKDLLAAEKELGVWREKIEKIEGEKRYYDNLVSLSTLSITLAERDIKAAAGAIERESIDAGVETQDVEKARSEATKAIEDSKGRIISSDLRKLDAGQFASRIVAEVPSESSGAITDRLRQLGTVTRMNVDRKQTTVDGSAAPLPGSHIEKKATTIAVNFYNIANVAPRRTSSATLAVNDVETTRAAIAAKVEKLGGRLISSQVNRPQPELITASIRFETRSADADAMLNDLRAAGEVMNLSQSENPDSANVTSAKRGFEVQIVSINSVAPRETTSQQIVVKSVIESHTALVEAVQKLGGRVLASSVSEGQRDQAQGNLDVEIPRAQIAEWNKTLAATGDSMSRSASRSTDLQNTIDTKARFTLTVYAQDKMPPRQTTNAGVNIDNAEKGSAQMAALAQQLGGRVVDSSLSKDENGVNRAHVVIDVSGAKTAEVLKYIRESGELQSLNTSTNQQIPDGTLAQSRFDVTFSEGAALLARDQGLWASLRDGIATSLRGLAYSVQLIVVGVCLVAPWVLIVWGGWKVYRRKAAGTNEPRP